MATQGPQCPRCWPSVERHPVRGSQPVRSGQGGTSQPGSGLLCGWKLGWSPGGFYSARCALPGAGAPPTSRSSAPRKRAVISGASCSRQIRESPVSSDPLACRWAWVLVPGHLSLRWEQPASSPRLATWLSGFRAHAGGTARGSPGRRASARGSGQPALPGCPPARPGCVCETARRRPALDKMEKLLHLLRNFCPCVCVCIEMCSTRGGVLEARTPEGRRR